MNEEKFTGKAGVYAKYRPSYPAELIDYLYSAVGFSKDSVIADIGSGTGKLTELLLKRGSCPTAAGCPTAVGRVYAVEPNGDMRAAAEAAFAEYTNFRSVSAAAEATGLPDASMDFITVAQAFHWFDRVKFKAECQRILRPRGRVVLVYNSKDSSDELVIAYDEVDAKFCPDFKGFSGGRRGEEPEAYADFFKDGHCEYRTFANEQNFADEESFIGRNLSNSAALKETDANYGAYIDAVREVFRKYSVGGRLNMPYVTRCYVGGV